MKCKRCGNTVNFSLMRKIAYWDDEEGLWIEDRDYPDEIMCNECNSFDIENEEWDFENKKGGKGKGNENIES